ncbi:MAG: hypothetical protein EOP45_11105 [Sphingobacteriaceae bacterium]|nr:MAG: hypothetical protein EOP45_11105 [Sphingobacteriaceae bacterium]
MSQSIPASATDKIDQTSRELVDHDNMDKITEDYSRILERLQIAGYYSRDRHGDVKRMYDLNEIVIGIIGNKTNTDKFYENWRSRWKRQELANKGIIQKLDVPPRSIPWRIEIQRFLIWCLFVNGNRFKLTDEAQLLRERLVQINPSLEDYSAIVEGPCLSEVYGETYSHDEAIPRVHDDEYLDRYIEYHAYHHKPRYYRRVSGKYDDLYEASQITEIGAPFQIQGTARHAIAGFSAPKGADGVVHIRGGYRATDRLLWTRGNMFLCTIWLQYLT